MKIAIGCDHAGVELKSVLIQLIENLNNKAIDKGPFSSDSVDYPDYGHAVATAGIRGALCWTPEIAALARQHNDANIIAIPARFISTEEAKEIVAEFLNHEFEGGRHQRRVGKIACK